ncbi:MAG TPA: DUF2079 domain-containing protein [Streptosporangiaceae bacterium]|nr:DUF2079 domain-containing protein [Streptosporangiaceae bacterium]
MAITAMVLLVAALYSTYSLFRFYTFNSSTFDLVIFDQAIHSYSHFQPGISIVKGLHNGFGPHFSELGDHWSPILASLAPLYWIHNGPQDLLIAQSVLFALAIPPIWLFTRRALGGSRKATVAAYLVSGAYALSWPIASAVAFDFHEVAFAPVLTAIALERIQAGKIRPALLALAALLLVKEDMGLLVAGVGCYLLVSRHQLNRQRILALCIIAIGLVDTGVATYVLIPLFGGRSDYYWAYDALGRNMPQLAWHVVSHPLRALRELVTPRIKLETMLWLFGAFAFLPLLSPISLAAVPLLLERMLASSFPNWWGVQFQYNAFIVVILLLAAVDGGVRLGRWVEWFRARRSAQAAQAAGGLAAAGVGADLAVAGVSRAGLPAAGPVSDGPDTPLPAGRATSSTATGPPVRWRTRVSRNVPLGAAALMLALAVILIPSFAFDQALHPAFYKRDAAMDAAAAAVAHVPSGVMVAAAGQLGPQLTARDTVVLWDGDGSTPPLLAPWVAANVSQPQFTFKTIAQQKKSVKFLRAHGYRMVFARDGYIVLHRVT